MFTPTTIADIPAVRAWLGGLATHGPLHAETLITLITSREPVLGCQAVGYAERALEILLERGEVEAVDFAPTETQRWAGAGGMSGRALRRETAPHQCWTFRRRS